MLQLTPSLEHKSLERDVGFLVHLSRTFPAFSPYLRGIYNTLNGWRKGRDRDGWKLTRHEWDLLLAMEEEMEEEEEGSDSPPCNASSNSPSVNPKISKAPSAVQPVS